MLNMEKAIPSKIAYDKPSPKLLGFLKKHYNLTEYIPQNNSYVVYNDYYNNLNKFGGTNCHSHKRKKSVDQNFNKYKDKDKIEDNLNVNPNTFYNIKNKARRSSVENKDTEEINKGNKCSGYSKYDKINNNKNAKVYYNNKYDEENENFYDNIPSYDDDNKQNNINRNYNNNNYICNNNFDNSNNTPISNRTNYGSNLSNCGNNFSRQNNYNVEVEKKAATNKNVGFVSGKNYHFNENNNKYVFS